MAFGYATVSAWKHFLHVSHTKDGSFSSSRLQLKTTISSCPCWVLSAFSPFLVTFYCPLSSLFIKVEHSFFRWLKPECKGETSPVPLIACPHTWRQCLPRSWGSDLFGEWTSFKIQCRKAALEEKRLRSSFALGSRHLCCLMTYPSARGSCEGPFLASSELNLWGAENYRTRYQCRWATRAAPVLSRASA